MCWQFKFSILSNPVLALLSFSAPRTLNSILHLTMSPAPDYFTKTSVNAERPRRVAEPQRPAQEGSSPSKAVYSNPRLDPANFLEGPLSTNPATRLRQMLARPGIVVSLFLPMNIITFVQIPSRLPLVSVMVLAHGAPSKLDLIVCTKGS